jgi:hypothetical protein
MLKTKEIETAMLNELRLHGFEDSPENRLDFLLGLRDGWREDTSKSLEKSLYMLALELMISRLMLKVAIRQM